METLAHQPVFPNEERTSANCDVPNSMMTGGLTKREYFAAMAMQGILSSTGDMSYTDYAEGAVIYADALIEALNKEGGE